MIGPEGLAVALAGLLRDQIVTEVDSTTRANGALVDGTGLVEDPEGDAPPYDAVAIAAVVTPQLVVPAPPSDVSEVQIEQWPFLAIDVRRAPKSSPVAATGPPALVDVGNVRAYTFEYEARIFSWVRGDGYPQVKATRDRLMLAVRQVLLRHQRFDAGIRLVEQTLTEEYAPVGVDTTIGATVGAGYTQARWRTIEYLPDVPSYGTVDTLTVSVQRADTP